MGKTNQSLGQKLIIGSGYSYFSLLVNKGITAVSVIFLARFLGPENFGIVSIVNYLLFLLLALTGLGIPTAAVKLISAYNQKLPEKVGEFIIVAFIFNLITIIFITLLYYLGASYIANQIYHEPQLSKLLQISAATLFFLSINQYANSVIQGFAEFKKLSFILIFNSGLSLLLLIPLTKFFGLKGTVLSQTLTSIGVFFLLLRMIGWLRKKYLLSLSFSVGNFQKLTSIFKQYFGELFSLALPVFLSGLCMTPVLTILTVLLSRLRGFQEVGFFNSAYSLSQVILFVPTAVGTPFIPLATKIAVANPKRLPDFLTKTIYGVAIIVMVLTFLMSFFSYEVIKLFYGAKYSPAQNILILMTAATFLASFGYIVGYYLLAVGKMWLATFLNLLWCIFILVPAFPLMNTLGLNGLGLDYLIAYILLTGVIIFYLKRYRAIDVRPITFLLGVGTIFPVVSFLTKTLTRFHLFNIGLFILFFTLFSHLLPKFVSRELIKELVGSKIKYEPK